LIKERRFVIAFFPGLHAAAPSRANRSLVVKPSIGVCQKQKLDNTGLPHQSLGSFSTPMFAASRLIPTGLTAAGPTILEFPAEATRTVRSSRNMTTQLLQEAAQVIPNQQLLINVVSKRVRQLGLGHRPMVEATPRMSLTDIALKEIIVGKLTYEELKEAADGAAA
jgi:DNA-directed RNA polymerase subunit omega